MLKIALTGNPFSGIDSISLKFKKLGIPIFNADLILNFILNEKNDVINRVNNILGYSPYTNGIFDASKVKGDEDFDSILDITELEIFESYSKFSKINLDKPYIIFSSHLIYERRLNNKFDIVINCFSPKDNRALRGKNEKNILFSDFLSQSKNEISEFHKNEQSHYVVHAYIGGPILDESILKINEGIINKINEVNSYILKF